MAVVRKLVMLSPFAALRVNSAKHACSSSWAAEPKKQLQGSFVVPIRSGLLRMTARRGFHYAGKLSTVDYQLLFSVHQHSAVDLDGFANDETGGG